ncbi:MAG: hypothetical protein ACK5H4_09255 [Lacrimispora sphenoides]
MNETRAPTNENIKEQVLAEYLKGIKPKELSEKTGVSINTIKSWIKREKSKKPDVEEGALASQKGAPSKIRKGAPPGNQNAKGAGAPDRNKNAEKHGAYSKIYWDTLDDTELELLGDIPIGEEYQLRQQVAMYTIRERRMLHQIEEFKNNSKKCLYIKSIKKKKRVVCDDKGEKHDVYEDMNTDTENTLKSLTTLEAELTKIQRAKTKCLDSLIHLKAVNERNDDLLNGWNSKRAAAEAENEDGKEDVVIYLPDNGRG